MKQYKYTIVAKGGKYNDLLVKRTNIEKRAKKLYELCCKYYAEVELNLAD